MAATIDEVKSLVEAQAAEHKRCRDDDMRWRGSFETKFEAQDGRIKAMETSVSAQSQQSIRQDSAIESLQVETKEIKDETKEQTRILRETHDTLLTLTTQWGALKYALPGLPIFVAALWWLFERLVHK